MPKENKKRAMSSEQASQVKKQGHADSKEFARIIGLTDDYLNDPKAKKDVIDKSGDSYSVKSGKKKWQIFLYGKTRFEEDYIFKAMNGIGQLLLDCINVYPNSFEEYKTQKTKYKNALEVPMKSLCLKLSEKQRLAAFIEKSMFNGGEVKYLAIKEAPFWHIFLAKEVVKALSENLVVENSRARQVGQFSNQKVVFKIGKTYGEIEMRNDSKDHFKEVKFWLDRNLTLNLLKNKINDFKKLENGLITYGSAIKTFGKTKTFLH